MRSGIQIAPTLKNCSSPPFVQRGGVGLLPPEWGLKPQHTIAPVAAAGELKAQSFFARSVVSPVSRGMESVILGMKRDWGGRAWGGDFAITTPPCAIDVAAQLPVNLFLEIPTIVF